MTTVSDLIGGSFPMLAGPSGLALNNLVQMGPDGGGYLCKTTDNCAAFSGIVIADTTLSQQLVGAVSYPLPAAIDSNHNKYLLRAQATTTGLTLVKYNSAGVSQGTVDLVSGASNTQINTASITVHPTTGNIIICYIADSPNYPTFAIYSPQLKVVLSPTTIESNSSSGIVELLILTGGNIVFCYTTSGPLLRFAIYNSAGSPVSAAATIDASAGVSKERLASLSTGNFAIAWTASAPAMKHAIYGPTGSTILAATTVNSFYSNFPFISSVSGFYGVVGLSAANTWTTYTFNNAGSGLGSFSVAHAASTNPDDSTYSLVDLTNDGSQFWFGMIAGTSGVFTASVTTAASGTLYNPITSSISSATCFRFQYDGNGFILGTYGVHAAQASNYFLLQTSNPSSGLYGPTAFGATPGSTGPNFMNTVIEGDFAFTSYYDINGGTVVPHFGTYKYGPTAIQGVCVAPASGGAYASVQPARLSPAGGGGTSFGVTPLAGSLSKTFNMNSTVSGVSLYGNKGIMNQNGVTLLGIQ